LGNSKQASYMKNIIRFSGVGVVAALLLIITGCTTAGPFVTNISSDGKGDIIVEKDTVEVNGLTGTVSSGNHHTQEVIRVVAAPAQ
jgi:type IV secretion system protein VirB7